MEVIGRGLKLSPVMDLSLKSHPPQDGVKYKDGHLEGQGVIL